MFLRSKTLRAAAVLALALAFAPVSSQVVPVASAVVGDCNPDPSWGTLNPSYADQVVTLTNQHRSDLGLVTLQVSPTLTKAAQWKALHMAGYSYLGHDDPAPPVARSPGQRLEACGYPVSQAGWGENIAYGYATPSSVMNGWLNSAGHKANIENSTYRAIGVGAASTASGVYYWSQEFGTLVDSGGGGGGGAPTVTLTSYPPSTTTVTSASFAWTTSGTVTSMTCSLDNAVATACTSPRAFNPLTVGTHTFRVNVSNSSGSNGATYTWTVSNDPQPGSPPSVTITSGPSATTTATSASFSWSAGGSPTSTVCSLDNAPASSCASPAGYSGLASGAHTFRVTVSNFYGSQAATYSWTISAPAGSAPTVTITNGPGSSTTSSVANFYWSTSGTVTSTTCTLDNLSPVACASPASYGNISLGSHTFKVTVSNASGSNTATYNWSVTGSLPSVWISSGPSLSTMLTSANFYFYTYGSVQTTTCSLDGDTPVACTSPKGYSGLAPGTHSFRVTVSNAAGSQSASYMWTVLGGTGSAPTVALTTTPASSTTATNATFAWSTSGTVTGTTCSLDGAAAISCSSPTTYSSLAVGTHSFRVTVANSFGSQSATYNWTVAAPAPPGTAPTVSITDGPGGSTTSTSASFGWTTSGTVSSTVCSLDGATPAACSSPAGYNGLAVGSHTFKVTVGNTYGNASATYNWTITAPSSGSAPTVNVTSGPASGTLSTDASFSWTTSGVVVSTTCSLDGAVPVTCAPPKLYGGLALGSHTFRVTASNQYGSTTGTYTWTIAAPAGAPPTVSITPYSGVSRTPTFYWTTTGSPTSTTCSLDNGPAQSCSSPGGRHGHEGRQPHLHGHGRERPRVALGNRVLVRVLGALAAAVGASPGGRRRFLRPPAIHRNPWHHVPRGTGPRGTNQGVATNGWCKGCGEQTGSPSCRPRRGDRGRGGDQRRRGSRGGSTDRDAHRPGRGDRRGRERHLHDHVRGRRGKQAHTTSTGRSAWERRRRPRARTSPPGGRPAAR